MLLLCTYELCKDIIYRMKIDGQLNSAYYQYNPLKHTLGDIFISLEMRRFFKEFAIFSDGQNFGFQNKIRRIIFDVFLSIVTASIHHLPQRRNFWSSGGQQTPSVSNTFRRIGS